MPDRAGFKEHTGKYEEPAHQCVLAKRSFFLFTSGSGWFLALLVICTPSCWPLHEAWWSLIKAIVWFVTVRSSGVWKDLNSTSVSSGSWSPIRQPDIDPLVRWSRFVIHYMLERLNVTCVTDIQYQSNYFCTVSMELLIRYLSLLWSSLSPFIDMCKHTPWCRSVGNPK